MPEIDINQLGAFDPSGQQVDGDAFNPARPPMLPGAMMVGGVNSVGKMPPQAKQSPAMFTEAPEPVIPGGTIDPRLQGILAAVGGDTASSTARAQAGLSSELLKAIEDAGKPSMRNAFARSLEAFGHGVGANIANYYPGGIGHGAAAVAATQHALDASGKRMDNDINLNRQIMAQLAGRLGELNISEANQRAKQRAMDRAFGEGGGAGGGKPAGPTTSGAAGGISAQAGPIGAPGGSAPMAPAAKAAVPQASQQGTQGGQFDYKSWDKAPLYGEDGSLSIPPARVSDDHAERQTRERGMEQRLAKATSDLDKAHGTMDPEIIARAKSRVDALKGEMDAYHASDAYKNAEHRRGKIEENSDKKIAKVQEEYEQGTGLKQTVEAYAHLVDEAKAKGIEPGKFTSMKVDAYRIASAILGPEIAARFAGDRDVSFNQAIDKITNIIAAGDMGQMKGARAMAFFNAFKQAAGGQDMDYNAIQHVIARERSNIDKDEKRHQLLTDYQRQTNGAPLDHRWDDLSAKLDKQHAGDYKNRISENTDRAQAEKAAKGEAKAAKAEEKASAGLPRVQSIEDVSKLAPGTRFVDPAGKVRVVPPMSAEQYGAAGVY